jgi:4-hydroxy 2-oxovalerate aldolase
MPNSFAGILDCTFRDGGYYTNWDFPDPLLDQYLDAMAGNAAVAAVELGYRAPPKASYHGRYFHLPVRLLQDVKSRLRSDQKLVVMLNEKDSSPEGMPGLLGDLSGIVDMVRFATPPTSAGNAVALTDACVELGFAVGLNIMYMHKYVDNPEVLAPLAGARAETIALVDSYGSCLPEQVSRAFLRAKEVLPQPLGFHGHDNIGLAFANSLAAITAGAASIDATVTGMGRGAGNVKTELLIAYLAMAHGYKADFVGLSRVVSAFSQLQVQYEWGSNLAYMISGFAGLPQADVMDWFGTRRYTLSSVVSALRQQGGDGVDTKQFPPMSTAVELDALRDRPVIVIGGGASTIEHAAAIADLVRATNGIVIHSTTKNAQAFDHCTFPQLYCLAGEELARVRAADRRRMLGGDSRFIVTQEPPRFEGTVPDFDNCYMVPAWLPQSQEGCLGPVADEAPLDLAFAAARSLQAARVYLAGFDGYPNASLADQQTAQGVQAAIEIARRTWTSDDTLVAVTPSLYDVPQRSVYGLIQGVVP